MNIGVVTPWPPDRSGIADYAYDLAKGLIKLNTDLTIYTLSDSPRVLSGCAIVNTQDYTSWPLHRHDLVVYQVGNNTQFHAHMLSLLSQYRGVVHLHDYVLHHMFAAITHQKGGWNEYNS